MSNIISSHTKRHIIKYKYGVKVPKRFKGAIKYYQETATPSGSWEFDNIAYHRKFPDDDWGLKVLWDTGKEKC